MAPLDRPSYWCDIPELQLVRWNDNMILNVSAPSQKKHSDKIEECTYYNRSYSEFAKKGYNWSMQHLDNASLIPCKYFNYNTKESVTTEWNLVCNNEVLKSSVQAALALGKFVGGFFFGLLSDKYGRKYAFNIAAFIYIVSGPSAALFNSYSLFLAARFFIGIAGAGVYQTAYTISTELTTGKTRTWVCLLLNFSYPTGYVLLAVTAYYIRPWRSLLLVISLPLLFMIINCWYLSESPKWLMSQGKKKLAWATMSKLNPSATYAEAEISVLPDVKNEKLKIGRGMFKEWLSTFTSMFSTCDMCAKTTIAYICSFVVGLAYYVIALNGDNFTANRYIYVALNGIVEGIAYVATIPLLLYVGRKLATSGLFFASGILLIVLLVIPKENTDVIITLALLGKFCVSAVFSISLLYISEMYPTSIRNTSLGTSLTVAQIGAIAAPYVVEILGAQAWYIPSTVCGLLSIFVSILILLLPETKGTKLPDTLDDMKISSPVSFTNFCKF
ncbi:organic cation transporter protein isoform X2 [Adelges cooleyi]|uniref:organic cation transporter protein isoform X2 n=1 Tax=Adelges cooleyi TaxID=133065 RepID=UPI0021808DAD|nr:organic cation transporter protein isoform X2 [Adelges cooleyi]